MMSHHRLLRSFTVPELSEPLARAHLGAMKQQMPLLYLIVSINSAVLAVMHYGVAPTALVILPLVTIVGASILRSIFWYRLSPEAIARDRQLPMLRSVNRITALLCVAILAWALALEHFSPEVSDMHILTFLSLTSIGCIFCLTHLRSAALTVAATVIVPTVGLAMTSQQTDLTAGAINLLLVALVVLRILYIQNRGFIEQVSQHESLKDLGEQNLRLATTDVLTGLANRRTFFPALDELLAKRDHDASPLMIAIVDLHGFKHVNDTFGHVVGDRVLAAIAERMAHVVPPHALLARTGGDEFAILATVERTEKTANYLELSMRACFDEFVHVGDLRVRVGGAMGVAWWEHGHSATDVLERADYAMYQAKAIGGNAIVLFDGEHEKIMRTKWVVETALRHANLDAELSLMFQPLVDVDLQRTIAFEALARWNNPELGIVPPDQFIAAAERIGVINDVSRVLFGKLLTAMENSTLTVVSFNLSIADIVSMDAILTIVGMISRSGIAPSRLHFEVTETAMLHDFSRAGENLNRLRELGSMVSLDDFGTGHSTLSHVHRLPVDKLKVDASFTREIQTHKTARSIVASIIGLAHGLGLDCIVEGVETVDQVILLRGLGCRLMQGYLFHKPMALADVEDYLRAEGLVANGDQHETMICIEPKS